MQSNLFAVERMLIDLGEDHAKGLGCSICKGPAERPGIYVQSIKANGAAHKSGLQLGKKRPFLFSYFLLFFILFMHFFLFSIFISFLSDFLCNLCLLVEAVDASIMKQTSMRDTYYIIINNESNMLVHQSHITIFTSYIIAFTNSPKRTKNNNIVKANARYLFLTSFLP